MEKPPERPSPPDQRTRRRISVHRRRATPADRLLRGHPESVREGPGPTPRQSSAQVTAHLTSTRLGLEALLSRNPQRLPMVETMGLEPTTSCLQSKMSLRPHLRMISKSAGQRHN